MKLMRYEKIFMKNILDEVLPSLIIIKLYKCCLVEPVQYVFVNKLGQTTASEQFQHQ
jgi:hypothetical protein